MLGRKPQHPSFPLTASETSHKPPTWNFGDESPDFAYSRAWVNLLRVQRYMGPKILKVLREEGITDPIWFEILMYVEQKGKEGHLTSALEGQLYLPQYAVSRHVARMEKAGLLKTSFIADGRRKQVLFVTETAKGLHARIWPIYFAAIKKEFAPRLSPEEAYALTHALLRLTH